MLILFSQEGLLKEWIKYSVLRWFHVNILPNLNGQIKARAYDCAVEGKGKARGCIELRKARGQWSKRTEEKVKGRWNNMTWPREDTSIKGSLSRGTD